jgi:hypothetical protein
MVRAGVYRVMKVTDLTEIGRGTFSAPVLQRLSWKPENTRTGSNTASRIKGSIIAKCTS